jgi:Ca2+-binding RTX toxin-like protein
MDHTYRFYSLAMDNVGHRELPPGTFDTKTTFINTPPVAHADLFNADEGVTLSVAAPGVLGNDEDADGDARAAKKVQDPQNGTLELHSDGSFVYVPRPDYCGIDTFTYQANDGRDDSPPATVTIYVNPVVQLPGGKGSNVAVVQQGSDNHLRLVNNKKQTLLDVPFDSMRRLTILGVADKSDTVTVDLANAASLLPDGIMFDAGGGKKADTLIIPGVAAGGAFALSAGAGPGSGTAAIDVLGIRFGGIEQVRFDGLAGNDTFAVSALPASLTINDKGGTDAVDFSGATGGVGVSVSLATASAQKIFGGTTTLTLKGKFENATGTPYADKITGSSAGNLIYGVGGDDSILGGAGNDSLYGGEGNDWLYGDAGNDILQGGPGNNVLLGGAGNDVLDVNVDVTAGTGRNLLIGGAGLDSLQGGLGEEILIGSTTKYDAKPLALAAIMEEWASDTPFLQRQTHLTEGFTVPGNPKLGLIQLVPKDKTHSKGTVLDDKAIDQLLGGLGDDWFFPFGSEVPNDG